MTTITIHDHHAAVALLQQLNAEGGPMAGHGLGNNDKWALLALDVAADLDEELTMSAFARRIGLSRAAVTSLVDRLETDGLVVRTVDPVDRRRTLLAITLRGSDLVESALTFDPEPVA